MCSAIWYMSIAQLTNPFPVPVEEEIAMFCEAKSIGAYIAHSTPSAPYFLTELSGIGSLYISIVEPVSCSAVVLSWWQGMGHVTHLDYVSCSFWKILTLSLAKNHPLSVNPCFKQVLPTFRVTVRFLYYITYHHFGTCLHLHQAVIAVFHIPGFCLDRIRPLLLT